MNPTISWTPIPAQETVRSLTHPESRPRYERDPIRIVLADGHTMFRQGLAPLLEAQPDLLPVAQAGDGPQAWRLIETLRPDLAVLDANLEGLTACEIAARAKDAGVPTRILLLITREDPCTLLAAGQAGIAGVVLKGGTVEELIAGLRTLAAGESRVSPSLQQRLDDLKRKGRAPAALSSREREVVRLAALGNSSKHIARALDISPRTVDTYRRRLMTKLDLRNLADLVRYACRTGMVS